MRNNVPVHDPEALWQARYILRKAHFELRTLRQVDPTVRCMITNVDDLCAEITSELDAGEPQLTLTIAAQEARP